MTGEALLQVCDLSVRFAGAQRDAVRGLSFVLAAGESLALVGPSGSGKTAAVRAVLGLSPVGTRVGGTLRWRGRDLYDHDERRRLLGSEMAYVFQDPAASLDPCCRVGDLLDETLAHNGWRDRAVRRRRREELLREVRLEPEWGSRFPHQLSGGEQQRVALALALAGDPSLLIADEPTTSLDPITQAEILELLCDLVADRGMAMVFITHDIQTAGFCAGRILALAAGEPVETGSCAEVLQAPTSELVRDMVAVLDGSRGPVAAAPPTNERKVLSVAGVCIRRTHSRTGTGRRQDAIPVVNDLDLEVIAGEAFGIVGRSGAGKTTLALALGGFLAPSSGRIDVAQPHLRGRPHPVQLIFQSAAASLDPRRTALQSVVEAAVAAGCDDPAGEARRLLAAVEMEPRQVARRPHALSGGQRQRVAIARALAAKPVLLVADEPASSLDLPLRARLVDLLDNLRQERDLGLILISHDLRLVRRCCSRIGVMERGRILEIVAHDAEPRSREGAALWQLTT